MTRRFELSDEQVEWLSDNFETYTNAALARKMGCCVDTLKRQLVRHGIAYFPGAKYHYRSKPRTWTRPCSICGSEQERPKFQYRCDKCHTREQSPEYDWADYHTDYSTEQDDGQSTESER